MPELPEVEATVRRLKSKVEGKNISSVNILWERSIANLKATTFKKCVIGEKINKLERHGKYLMFRLDHGAIFLHLRMSGKIAVFNSDTKNIKHTRIVFTLNDGHILRFDDVRKFGKCFYVKDENEILNNLGLEPLSREFTLESLKKIFNRNAKIKSVLLDQKLIAGIGNIYADESLWRAKINPCRPASSLTEKEIYTWRASIQDILKNAIKVGGTDFGDNVVVGNYSPQIYGHDGEECPRCKTIIEKIQVGQRGTHFCPKCQKL